MTPKKFNLNEISEQFTEVCSPKNIEIINNFVIRVAKFDGEYHWYKHNKQDELFLVFRGKIKIQTKTGDIILGQGEGVKIPKGLEHCPVSIETSIVLLFESLELKSKGDYCKANKFLFTFLIPLIE
jgi:mannose-6-phosphate isomerase-like protein (cupin superfamily)